MTRPVSIHASVREATIRVPLCIRVRGFQSTPPCGRRLARDNGCYDDKKFQSTPPCGRRPPHHAIVKPWSLFQSTPPCGRRPPRQRLTVAEVQFQSTPPCGRRPSRISRCLKPKQFQSTPPCGRRHFRCMFTGVAKPVSIHASVREATVQEPIGPSVYKVSIHASVREATRMLCSLGPPSLFQSTPPCGRRRIPHRS